MWTENLRFYYVKWLKNRTSLLRSPHGICIWKRTHIQLSQQQWNEMSLFLVEPLIRRKQNTTKLLLTSQTQNTHDRPAKETTALGEAGKENRHFIYFFLRFPLFCWIKQLFCKRAYNLEFWCSVGERDVKCIITSNARMFGSTTWTPNYVEYKYTEILIIHQQICRTGEMTNIRTRWGSRGVLG